MKNSTNTTYGVEIHECLIGVGVVYIIQLQVISITLVVVEQTISITLVIVKGGLTTQS